MPYLVARSKLEASYKRCEQAGVSRDLRKPRDILNRRETEQFLAGHWECILRIRPLLFDLYRDIQDKSTILVLTDARGRAIDLLSSPEMLAVCAGVGIRPGTSFAEESCGTNAISLALFHQEIVVIRGMDHYCRLFHDSFCIASPIPGPDGKPVACFDISMNHEAALGFALAFVKQAVRNIADVLLFSPPVEQTVAQEECALTKKQTEILSLWAAGLSYGEISAQLGIAEKTIEEHLAKIRTKLGARTNRECIKVAALKGLLK